MHQFIMRNRKSGNEHIIWGIGKTAEEARTKILIYNCAKTDFTVWELIG